MELVLSTINAVLDTSDDIDQAISLVPDDDKWLANAVVAFAGTVAEYEAMHHDN
jgi:hypothetical protein